MRPWGNGGEGWWGIAFAALLLVVGGMVSVPTADDPAAKIVAFYAANASIVIAAQVGGIVALLPLVLFVRALAHRAPDPSSARRLIAVLVLVVIAELATNVPPLVLALTSPSGSAAHAWTVAGDLADAALFASLGLLALAAIPGQASWLRWFGVAVAALAFVRAVGSPLGFTALDAIAPIAFLAFVVALSVQMLRVRPAEVA